MKQETKCYCGHTDYCDCEPLEEPKQETPKTFKELFANTGIKPTTDANGIVHYNFKATLKDEPKQERMFSEEDLREAFKGGGKMSWADMNQETQEPYYYDFNEWFEQFNKKLLNNKI